MYIDLHRRSYRESQVVFKNNPHLAHINITAIVIKAADKGSSVVLWHRSDYLKEASRQLQDKNIYEGVKFSENIHIDSVERSNKTFKSLCSHKLISEKELKGTVMQII